LLARLAWVSTAATGGKGSPAMSTREARLVENEETFRDANSALASAVGDVTAVVPYLCECADDKCLGRVDLTRSEYEAVRAHPNRFFILVGHPQAEGEHVVERFDRYEIVEKE
jgi:hypothetical protein